MRVSYGVGLLQLVPADWFVVEEQKQAGSAARYKGPPPPSQRRAKEAPEKTIRREYLEKVSMLGISQVFCELVEGEVLEVANRGGTVASRWLSASEGAGVAKVVQEARGQLIHDQLPKGFDADFYVPAYTAREGVKITLPSYQAPCWVEGTTQGLNVLRRGWSDVLSADRVFVKEMMDAFELAHAHRLFFWLWWD